MLRRLFHRRFGHHNKPSAFVIYAIYVAAIGMTTALLVFWVAVVQRFNIEINKTLARLGFESSYFHYFIQTSGAGLFFLVIVALTYLLALSLSERRYSRKQEEFLSNMTHELKTPVAAIKLHAQTLEQGGLEEHELQRFTGFIRQEADRVSLLVDNLLEGSRLGAHGRVAAGELQPTHIGEFFEGYAEAVEGRFDLHKVELSFEIQSQALVLATNEALQRILDNLIDNALRFTSAGDRILCKVRDMGRHIEIVVADTGVGIPKRELPKIFDRFYRLRREIGETRKRGTGLGLAIVRGLVEEMNGRIRAVSGDQEPGTRFEIQLPQLERDADVKSTSQGSRA